jgi:hypothetical protein
MTRVHVLQLGAPTISSPSSLVVEARTSALVICGDSEVIGKFSGIYLSVSRNRRGLMNR